MHPTSIAFEHFFVLHPEMNYKQTSNDKTPYMPENELEYLKQDLSSFKCFFFFCTMTQNAEVTQRKDSNVNIFV